MRTCNANGLGGSFRCTLEEGHEGWHQEWDMEDGEMVLMVEWKYTAKEERTLHLRENNA